MYHRLKKSEPCQRFPVREGKCQNVVDTLNSSLKKNLNASRLSEHPPVRGKECQNV